MVASRPLFLEMPSMIESAWGRPPFLQQAVVLFLMWPVSFGEQWAVEFLQAPEVAGVIYESWIIWPWVLVAPPRTCLIPHNHWSQIIEGQRRVRGGEKAQWLQERPARQLLQWLKTPLVTALNTDCSRHLKGRRVSEGSVLWEESQVTGV